ncbi:major facilitator superfamily domain-containing protein [Russula brevipes]|nr:major facilitator superfamily domain-containing protein [Russula brevipes]
MSFPHAMDPYSHRHTVTLPCSHRNTAVTLDTSRRAALDRVDRAPFSLFHIKVWLVAGAGFFTDAYDIFTISMVTIMLGNVYGKDNQLKSGVEFGLKVASPIGNLVGQLFFGWLADIVGRKRMYGIELMIIVTSTFAQALAGSGPAVDVIGVLTFWRFIMGVGIGGDYPLSAVISSEFAATRSRGRLMTAVFASQGWGYLASTLVSLVVVSAFKDAILQDSPTALEHVDYCWRILIGAGCIPGIVALYFRLTIPETPRFTMDIERNVKKACRNIEAVLSANGVVPGVWPSLQDFRRYFGQWKNARVLLGTAYSWFALDIAFYGLGLNSSKIFTSKILFALGLGSEANDGSRGLFDNMHDIIIYTLIIVSTPLQLMGFVVLSALFLVMGFQFEEFNQSNWGLKILMFLFCVANFFQNFGPNVTTFVIPGEVFPTRYRCTGHGFSAACGKLGAIVAQVIFYLQGDSIQTILQIFGFVMLSGVASTLLLPETRRRSLEELSNESQRGFIRDNNVIELRNGIVLRRVP